METSQILKDQKFKFYIARNLPRSIRPSSVDECVCVMSCCNIYVNDAITKFIMWCTYECFLSLSDANWSVT